MVSLSPSLSLHTHTLFITEPYITLTEKSRTESISELILLAEIALSKLLGLWKVSSWTISVGFSLTGNIWLEYQLSKNVCINLLLKKWNFHCNELRYDQQLPPVLKQKWCLGLHWKLSKSWKTTMEMSYNNKNKCVCVWGGVVSQTLVVPGTEFLKRVSSTY